MCIALLYFIIKWLINGYIYEDKNGRDRVDYLRMNS